MSLFTPRANALVRTVLAATAAALVVVVVGLLGWVRTPTATGQYAPVAQPVPFDHVLHTRALRLDCRYCHTSVERGPYAGLPSTRTCVACHTRSLLDAPVMEPVRASLRTGRAIRWSRVHALPDFVYFSHAIHVNKGVGCESCHGRVDAMSQVYQTAPLTMQWCVDCHREPERTLRPVAEMTTMGYAPSLDDSAGPALARRYGVRPGITCTTCHR